MTEEKGPHCSLTQTMLERYLPDAVKKYNVWNGDPVPIAPKEFWEDVKKRLEIE